MRILPRFATSALTLAFVALGVFPAYATPEEAEEEAPVVAAMPQSDINALVFDASEEVVLTVNVVNRTEEELRLAAAVGLFKGDPVERAKADEVAATGETVVFYGVKNPYAIKMLPGKIVATGEAVVKTGEGTVKLDLGRVPPNFYMVDLQMRREDKVLSSRKYPLGVFENTAVEECKAPIYPVGLYTRFMQYKRKEPPIFWKTYLYAMANDMRKHNINAYLVAGGFQEGEVDLANSHGIAGIDRSYGGMAQQGLGSFAHPGVIACFVKDEPKPGTQRMEEVRAEYEFLRGATDKLFGTAMIGEHMGLGIDKDPVLIWRDLQPTLRVFRWYGIKKHFYDVLHPVHYKGTLPYTSVLRVCEASSDTPWWVILPAFGKIGEDDFPEVYYQNPSPAQLECMTHLACAYGADGLMYFEYQRGLVDPVTLQPRDGNWDRLGEVLNKIGKHAEMIASIEHIGFDIRCPSPVVEAVPIKVGTEQEQNEQLGVYAVNKDPVNPVTTRIMLRHESWTWTTARDVFEGKDILVGPKGDDGYLSIPLKLAPGEGKLITTDAAATR